MSSAPTPTAAPAETADRLRLAITRLHRTLRQQSGAELTLTQRSALATVGCHGPLTLGDLAARERLAPPTVTKVVQHLAELGYVERTPDPADRRVARASITQAGRALLDDVASRRTAWLAERVDALPAAERRRLEAALGVLEELAGGGGEPS